jgi:hypothetical protein
MTQPLPLRANLEWLKKESKQRLAEMRERDPQAKLSDAQRDIARQYGYASWRRLKTHVEQMRDKLQELIPENAVKASRSISVESNDPELLQLLAAARAGNVQVMTQLLGRRPELARGHGPDGQTPLHIAAQCDATTTGWP